MILTAMQSAAIRLMGQKPQPFYGGAGQFEAEICDIVNEVAEDIAQYRDWQALVRTHTIAGDGVATSFPLPSDYSRMLLNSSLQDTTSWAWGFSHYLDINEFLYAQARGFQPFPGGWILSGGELQFAPAPSSGTPATFPYITKNWAISAAQVPKAAFTADDDTFLLPERLLTLGLVWRWREQKKLDASGDQEAFIKALDEYAAKDGGSRIQRRSSRRVMPGTYPAYPYELGSV